MAAHLAESAEHCGLGCITPHRLSCQGVGTLLIKLKTQNWTLVRAQGQLFRLARHADTSAHTTEIYNVRATHLCE